MFVHEMVPVEAAAGLPIDTAALEVMIGQLRDHGCTGDDDTERITQIGLLETLKSVASAVQAVLTADFARSREAELARIATESVRDRARRDVGAQIGLARRVSPRVGTRLVGMAQVLTGEMPALMGAFRRGAVDEYQALLVVAETATLLKEHRQAVDTELAGRFGTLSARRAHTEAARIGYRLDPDQAVKRLRKGLADRRVTLRPAPDTMSYLTALLPATEGVAILAALTNYAATATALGDPRGKGALMADELFTRLVQPGTPGSTAHPGPAGARTAGPGSANACLPDTGLAGTDLADTDFADTDLADTDFANTDFADTDLADTDFADTDLADTDLANTDFADTDLADTDRIGDPCTSTSTSTGESPGGSEYIEPVEYLDDSLPAVPAGVNIEIHLVMTDRTLLDGDDEPATLTGYGPIPAPLARHLARGASTDTTVWVRRLYTDPHTGTLTRSDPRRRLFSHVDRQFLVTRDQVCRTPWCDAPIRHADHTRPHAAGGPTRVDNGAGLCAACNHTKEHPGWTHDTADDGTILVTTPTGHHYVSRPPDPPRSDRWELVA